VKGEVERFNMVGYLFLSSIQCARPLVHHVSLPWLTRLQQQSKQTHTHMMGACVLSERPES